MNYKVFEDNGGGLHLVVYNQKEKPIYYHSGYEYVKGQLTEDLKALKDGDNPVTDWEGNEIESLWTYEQEREWLQNGGLALIDDNGEIFLDRMGGAGAEAYEMNFYGDAHQGNEYEGRTEFYQYFERGGQTYMAIWSYDSEYLGKIESMDEIPFDLEDIDRIEEVVD